MRRVLIGMLAALIFLPLGCDESSSPGAEGIRIGFLVKRPEEKWFQDEWRYAQECADKYHFKLIKIGATDGEQVLSAIDNLGAQGAQGLVICTPDVKLGPAIVAKAKANGLKLFTVDDRLVDADGTYLDVPYMGISARKIGETVGHALAAEMKKRGWDAADTSACAVTFDELDTGRERTEGSEAALVADGFPEDRVYHAPEKTTDVEGAFNAANVILTQHPEVKHWLVFSINDEGVLGAVRAMEGRGLSADDVIGIGIGASTGLEDFRREKPTGFCAAVLINPYRHGYETTEMMYQWIKDGVPPPPVTYTVGVLLTRDNYQQVLEEHGLSE